MNHSKKLFSIGLAGVLAAVGIAGGSLAYFTDTDDATNTFTAGNIKIQLIEKSTNTSSETVDFSSLTDEEKKLIPGREIHKDVTVQNIGTEYAYVRVHIAVPAALDDLDWTEKETRNLLHFDFTDASVVSGQWSWLPAYTDGIGYPEKSTDKLNAYSAVVDGISYHVYVVTYRTRLAANGTTATEALDKVYIDKNADAETDGLGHLIYTDKNDHSADMTVNNKILVFAESVQSEGFANAYEAFDASFGAVGTYDPWTK